MDDSVKLPKTLKQIILTKLTYTYEVIIRTSPPVGVLLNVLLYIYISSPAFYSLLPSDPDVIAKNSSVYYIVNTASFVYRNLASDYHITNSIIPFFVALGCYILSLILFTLGYFAVKRTGRLSKFSALILEFNAQIFTRILMLAFTGFMGSAFYEIIATGGRCDILIYFIFIISIIVEWFQLSVICQVLNNRLSYQKGRTWGWTPANQIRAIALIQIYGFITRLAERSQTGDKYLWIGISILLLIVFCVIPYFLPILIDTNMNAIFLSSSFSGIIAILFITIWKGITSQPIPSDMIVIFYIGIIGLSYYLILFFLKRRIVKSIELVERWAETGEDIDVIFRNWYNFLYCFRSGFVVGNPVILSWEIVREALKVWPKVELLHRQFIIFLSSFASDSSLFELTVAEYSSIFSHGNASNKFFVKQADDIISSRAKSATTKIQRKLSGIRMNTLALHKSIEDFWKLVSQHQTSHVYSLAHKSSRNYQLIESEFRKQVTGYPNCYHVLMSYGDYIENFVGDLHKSSEIKNYARQIRNSKDLLWDPTDIDMHKMFPYLPVKKEPLAAFKKQYGEEQKLKLDISSVSSDVSGSSIADLKETETTHESSAFLNGLKSREITYLKAITVLIQFVSFTMGIIIPGVYFLISLRHQNQSIELMAYISYFPVSIARVTMASTLEAVRRENLILTNSQISQIFNEKTMPLGELFAQTRLIIEAVIENTEKGKTHDAGLNSDVQTFFSVKQMDMIKKDKDNKRSYSTTIQEALLAYQTSIGNLGNSADSEDWIAEHNVDFNTLLLNCDTLVNQLFDYTDIVVQSIAEFSSKSVKICQIIIWVFLVITLILTLWSSQIVKGVRLFYERLINVLMSIPRSTFNKVINKSGDKEEKGEAFVYELRLNTAYSNSTTGKANIPTKLIGYTCLTVVVLFIVMNLIVMEFLQSSTNNVMKCAHVISEVARLTSYSNIATINMLKLRTLSDNVNLDELTTEQVAKDLMKQNKLMRELVTFFTLDEEYGVIRDNNHYISTLVNRQFDPFEPLHNILKNSDPLVVLQFMLEEAQTLVQNVNEGKPVPIDDETLILYGHSVLYHHYETIFTKIVNSACVESNSVLGSQTVFIACYMIIGLLGGIVLLIVVFTGSSQMQTVIDFIVTRLRFFDQNELLTCGLLMDFLSGIRDRRSGEKDLRYVIGTNKIASSASFILSPNKQITWANDAAKQLVGLNEVLNDSLGDLVKFEDPSVMDTLKNIHVKHVKHDPKIDFSVDTLITTKEVKNAKKRVRIVSMLDKGALKYILIISPIENENKKEKINELNEQIKVIKNILLPQNISSQLFNSNRVLLENVSIIQIKLFIDENKAIEVYKSEHEVIEDQKLKKRATSEDVLDTEAKEGDDNDKENNNKEDIQAIATMNAFNKVIQKAQEEAGNDFMFIRQIGFSLLFISVDCFNEDKAKDFVTRVERVSEVEGTKISATIVQTSYLIITKNSGDTFNVYAREFRELMNKSSRSEVGQTTVMKIDIKSLASID